MTGLRIEGVIAEVELRANITIRKHRLWLVAIRWLVPDHGLCVSTVEADQAVAANRMMGEHFGQIMRLAERVN